MITETSGRADRLSGGIWRFADCEFDERRRELRVRGAEVDVEVKPLAVLHQLLLHAGEVVTKAELVESVWPDVAVADNSLATAISKIRKLLGDDGRVIRTVPRVGYKMAVPVHFTPASVPSSPALQFEPGQRVPGRDQWQLARRLDRSPSGEVWLAEHMKTHEARVFKFAPDVARLRSLKREVTVARVLREALGQRPDFVRLLEWNFETPPYFIESEYAGPNLSEWAQAQGGLAKIPWDVRVKLLIDVARAVAAAHDLDLLHKDLKPGNILVTHNPGQTPQVKIADFGSASLLVPERLRALGITNLGFTDTGAGGPESLTGTLMYLAPEVLAGQAPTAASDVYAPGVLLYQLAVGDFRRPFAPGWEASVPDPFVREDIAGAAAVDPLDRFASASALADRLSDLDRRRREAESMEQAAPAAASGGFVHGNRGWIVAAGVAAIVVTIIAILALGLSKPRPSETLALKTVAVLPFQDAGLDSGLDYLRLALADEIATTLTRADGITVRPFPMTSTFDTADIDVQKAGAAVTDAVPEPRNEEAYELYLKSSVLPYDPGQNPQAVSMLQRAVALDPTYAPAWLSLSRRYTIEGHYGNGSPVMRDHAMAAADRAAELDPGNVHVLATRAAMDLREATSWARLRAPRTSSAARTRMSPSSFL